MENISPEGASKIGFVKESYKIGFVERRLVSGAFHEKLMEFNGINE